MASRATTLAEAIVTALNAWGSMPVGCTAARVRSVTHLITSLPDATPAVIAVIVPEIEDQSNRADVAEDVVVAVVLIAKCDSSAVAASDDWDELTEDLRDYLRTSTTFKNINLGGTTGAQRRTVSTTVTCDAELHDQSELFVSVTEARWFISIGNRS